MGGYTAPPLKTRFCRGSRNPNLVFGNFRKKVRISSPKDGPAGGDPHFFSKIGENGVWISATFLKKWSNKGVPPFWVIFGHFGPKWPQTVDPWGTQWGARY